MTEILLTEKKMGFLVIIPYNFSIFYQTVPLVRIQVQIMKLSRNLKRDRSKSSSMPSPYFIQKGIITKSKFKF